MASDLERLGHQYQLVYSVQRIDQKFHLSDTAGSQITNVPAGANYLPRTSPIGHTHYIFACAVILTVKRHQLEQSAMCHLLIHRG